jgi:small-conductance mechanosensitive channel
LEEIRQNLPLADAALGALASLGVAAVRVAETIALAKVDLKSRDNLEARKWYTQVRVLKRIALVLVVMLTVAVVLMSYERLRQLGAGLLASAGIAGVILGFAAQKTLSNLLAGFQIATTQPIRIDDVVVVEGEWGRIEEITLTYVVVCIWDLRCEVRERLLDFLQREHPDAPPRFRVDGPGGEPPATGPPERGGAKEEA